MGDIDREGLVFKPDLHYFVCVKGRGKGDFTSFTFHPRNFYSLEQAVEHFSIVLEKKVTLINFTQI